MPSSFWERNQENEEQKSLSASAQKTNGVCGERELISIEGFSDIQCSFLGCCCVLYGACSQFSSFLHVQQRQHIDGKECWIRWKKTPKHWDEKMGNFPLHRFSIKTDEKKKEKRSASINEFTCTRIETSEWSRFKSIGEWIKQISFVFHESADFFIAESLRSFFYYHKLRVCAFFT